MSGRQYGQKDNGQSLEANNQYRQGELLEQILIELAAIRTHLEMVTGETIAAEDITNTEV